MMNPFRQSAKTLFGLTPAVALGGSRKRQARKQACLRRPLNVEQLETRLCPTLPGAGWMGYVSDATSLFQMSLPATHDTMTGSAPITAGDVVQFLESSLDDKIRNAIPDFLETAYEVAWYASQINPLGGLPGGPDLRQDLVDVANALIEVLAPLGIPIAQAIAQTQDLSLGEQLDEGVRALDIRVEQTHDQLQIVHGHLPIGNLFFDSAVLQVATDFLAQNPTETVVMQVQVDNNDGTGNTKTVDQTFQDYESELNPDTGKPYGDYIWDARNSPIPPTLGQARGKIVIIQSNAVDGVDPSLGWNPADQYFPNSYGGQQPIPGQVPPDIFNPIQNTFDTSDLDYKWQLAQNQFNNDIPVLLNSPITFAVNYLSTNKAGDIFSSHYALPRFMATGSGVELQIHLPTSVDDAIDDLTGNFITLDTVSGPGMNSRTEDYINSLPPINCTPAPLGIVFTDFAPASLIQAIYSHNPILHLTPPANQAALENAPQIFKLGSFSDDPAQSPWTVDVNWGDGSPDTIFAQTAVGQIDPTGANSGHVYNEDGNYTVTVEITNIGSLCSDGSFVVAVKDNVGILLLDSTGQSALQASGYGQVSVTGIFGGAILVNSTNAQAVSVSGNASVSASETDIDSSPGVQVSGTGTLTGEINLNEPAYPDPLVTLATPTASGSLFRVANISGNNSITLQPGTYLRGISVSGQASVTLAPGVYILQGGGFSISGQAHVTGQQVMLFNSPVKQGDSIQVSAQGTLSLIAPTSGPYKGIAIFEDRVANAPALQFSGQANVQITGTIYAATALTHVADQAVLHLQGNAASKMGAHLIVADLQVSGNGVVKVDTSFNNLAPLDPPALASTVGGDMPLSSAQISAFVTANLPNLVYIGFAAFTDDNSVSVTGNVTAAEVLNLASTLILAELPSAGVNTLDQLFALELDAIDQALVTLES